VQLFEKMPRLSYIRNTPRSHSANSDYACKAISFNRLHYFLVHSISQCEPRDQSKCQLHIAELCKWQRISCHRTYCSTILALSGDRLKVAGKIFMFCIALTRLLTHANAVATCLVFFSFCAIYYFTVDLAGP